MLLAQKAYVRGRPGAGAVLRAAGRRAAHRRCGRGGRGRPAARGADADRQELAQRMVPGGQHPGDPGPRRLRLHARLPGRAVLARQPPEHDPRGHARHPGAGPAGPQGADGGRCRPDAAGGAHRRHDRARRPCAGPGRAGAGAGRRAAEAGRRDPGRLGHRRARGGAGQRDALPAGLRPRRAGLDLARRGAGRRARRGQCDAPAGLRAAMRYFFAYELPKIDAWLGVVASRDDVCRTMREEWF